MGISIGQVAPTLDVRAGPRSGSHAHRALWEYIGRNRQLAVGITFLGLLALFVILGHVFYDVSKYRPLSVLPGRPPAAEYPLGTDSQGRDILAVMIAGTPLTIYMGLLAGFLGVAIGTVLAFAGAYYGGWLDAIVRGVVDV